MGTSDRAVGTLKGRGGREYPQAVIEPITDVGLEIDYAGGMARIQAPDLVKRLRSAEVLARSKVERITTQLSQMPHFPTAFLVGLNRAVMARIAGWVKRRSAVIA